MYVSKGKKNFLKSLDWLRFRLKMFIIENVDVYFIEICCSRWRASYSYTYDYSEYSYGHYMEIWRSCFTSDFLCRNKWNIFGYSMHVRRLPFPRVTTSTKPDDNCDTERVYTRRRRRRRRTRWIIFHLAFFSSSPAERPLCLLLGRGPMTRFFS